MTAAITALRGRVWAVVALALSACFQDIVLSDQDAGAPAAIGPSPLILTPIDFDDCTEPGCTDVCQDFTCCGTILDPPNRPFDPTTASSLVVRERCCRTFSVDVNGSDLLVGARWLPGTGANLDVIADQALPLQSDPTKTLQLPGCYRMAAEKADPCGPNDGSRDPTCETGLPADDGIIRYFFRSTPTVDIYVEAR